MSLALVCGAWAGAQTNAAASVGSEESTLVAGTVVDEQGQPVADVAVVAYRPNAEHLTKYGLDYAQVAEAHTDAGGRFSFSLSGASQTELFTTLFVWRKAGLGLAWRYAAQALWQEGLGAQRITMPKAGSASGTVVGADGKAVEGAVVVPAIALAQGEGGGRMVSTIRQVLSAQTDKNGAFKFEGLPAGSTLAFLVTHPAYAVTLEGFKSGGGPISDLGFKEGQTDIRIQLKPAARIEGTVRFPDGKPVEGAEVIAMASNPADKQAAPRPERNVGPTGVNTDPQGRYAITDRPEGTYDLAVRYPDWTAKALRNVKATANKTVAGQDFALMKGVLVAGKFVRAETQGPVAGCCVFVSGPDTMLPQWPVKAGEDGAFSFRLPPSGDLEVSVRAEPGQAGRLKADQAGQHFKIEEGKDRTDLIFTVLPFFMARGKVTDAQGKPVAGAEVLQWRGGSTPAKTGPDGTYALTLRHVTPGEYEMVVLEARDGEAGGRRGSTASAFASESDVQIDIRVLPTASATGRVVDNAAKPLAGAAVRVNRFYRIANFGRMVPDKTLMTDADGRYVAEGLMAEVEYGFRATKAGLGRDQREDVKLESGKKADIPDLALLPADQKIAGIVFDEEGKPAAGVSVYANSEHSGGKQAMTGEDGRFAFEGLVNESVEVHASLSAKGPQYYASATVAVGDDSVELTLAERSGRSDEDVQAKRLVDKEAPAWEVAEWVRGAAIDLAGLRGATALVAFVDLTGEKAGAALALLNATASAHNELKIVAIQVAGPAKADVEKAAKGLDASIALALDKPGEGKAKTGATAAKYHAKRLPALYVIDKEGKVQFQDVAPAALEKVLKSAPAAPAPAAAAKPATSVESPVMEGRPATGAK